MREQYHMADDCPNCGQKDEIDQWKGARHGGPWGHDFMCCSDKCGREFASNPKRFQIELERVESRINALRDQATVLRGKVLIAKNEWKKRHRESAA